MESVHWSEKLITSSTNHMKKEILITERRASCQLDSTPPASASTRCRLWTRLRKEYFASRPWSKKFTHVRTGQVPLSFASHLHNMLAHVAQLVKKKCKAQKSKIPHAWQTGSSSLFDNREVRIWFTQVWQSGSLCLFRNGKKGQRQFKGEFVKGERWKVGLWQAGSWCVFRNEEGQIWFSVMRSQCGA